MGLFLGADVVGDGNGQLVVKDRQDMRGLGDRIRPLAGLVSKPLQNGGEIFVADSIEGLEHDELAHAFEKVNEG